MRKSRFTEEQIIGVLKEHQAGLPVAELCREHGISDATFYTWRSKYGGMEVSDAAALRWTVEKLEADISQMHVDMDELHLSMSKRAEASS